LGGHIGIAISDCRSLSQSLSTFLELYVVVNTRFAVAISMLSVIVSAISGFVGYFRLSMVDEIAWEHVSSISVWAKFAVGISSLSIILLQL